MLRSIKVNLLLLFITGSLYINAAEGRLNLPQARQVVQLGSSAGVDARNYFSRPQAAGELRAPLQEILLRGLSDNFLNACGNLMEEWGGERARGTSYWRVRLLDLQGTRAWLAFHCRSRLKDLAQDYDERLAVLRLDTATLELLPLAPDAENDSDLYHLEFAKRLTLKNALGFSFRVMAGDNPCCDGPESRSQERLMVFVDTPGGAFESLSVVTARDDLSHCDDPEVDTETKYHADVEFERDANNFVTTAKSTFRETVIDTTWESGKAKPHTVNERSGTLHFRWNAATSKFEEIR